MNAAGLTNKGQIREQNQDAILVSCEPLGPLPNLFIVADGVGGHNAGDIASTQAITYVYDYIRNFQAAEFVQADNYLDLLVTAVQGANSLLCKMADEDEAMHDMGTTLTACVVAEDKLVFAHVGDSRAYTITDEGMTQITADHSYVEEMIQAGQLTAEEALTHPKRHVITRVLGSKSAFVVDEIVMPIGDTRTVLLCSDGLNNMLDDNTIKEIASGVGFVEHRTKFLVEEANARGGHDNISAILIDVSRK
ncbi:MAG: Stp1/IreP family PP2C-type Ser/Thr phosphatase [Firmicutes bacterium]|nr:Stp1/IreP family PP2C-type Ser/Thr phosphatase [Bacillota bacterium]